MDYANVFNKRAKSYVEASSDYPYALAAEFKTAVSMCDLFDGCRFVGIPLSCEDVRSYITHNVNFINYETNAEFSKLTECPLVSLDAIPEASQSVDRILSLATLHHSTPEERAAFYKECVRILKPGGKLIIGDVCAGTPQDIWLNTFVNANNSCGHAGVFWSTADVLLLESCGFSVKTYIKEYTWDFDSAASMTDFCKKLFYLDLADRETIQLNLKNILGASETQIPWKLMYFVASIP